MVIPLIPTTNSLFRRSDRMSKRFTDTEKWKKRFVRGLESPYKLLWLYIIDDCDHAGIWHVDFEVAKIRIGCPEINEERALTVFADKITQFDDGEKWFIESFVFFQYVSLNETNRAHKSVISILKKYGLFKGLNKGLIRGSKDPKDKDKDKDLDKDKDKNKDKETPLPDEKLFQNMLELWRGWRSLKKTKGQEISERFNMAEEESCRQLVKMTGGLSPANLAFINHKMKKYIYDIDGYWSDRKHPIAGLVQRFNEIQLEKAPPVWDTEPEPDDDIHNAWCDIEPCTCGPQYLKKKGYWKEGFGLKELDEMYRKLRKEFKADGTKP